MISRLMAIGAVLALASSAGCGGSGATCAAGERECGGRCVDVTTDHDNCGGCGNVCGADQTCRGSECTCSAGLEACGTSCVNLDSDPANCGTCARTCEAGERCFDGVCGSCQPELCNNRDDDCDGIIDNDLTRPCDNACGEGVETCVAGAWVGCTAPSPSPEVCDGLDNNCNGQIDEGVLLTFYRDADGDGFGDPSDSVQACTAPAGYVDNRDDCDDTNRSVNPTAVELCDGVDNNCNGTTDEGCTCTLGAERYCGEGGETGLCEYGVQRCIDTGSGASWGECTGGVRPVPEICDGLDNDCDGLVDEGLLGDSYEANNDCGSARGPFTVLEGGDVVTLDATLYTGDGVQDQDWFVLHAEEATHLSCGWPWELLPQCNFYFTSTLRPPTGAAHADWQLCIQVRDSSGCGGAPDMEFCTTGANWRGTRYELTLVWEGTCWLDDSWDFFAVVKPAGTARLNDCRPYQATFQLVYTNEDCE